MGSAEIRMKHHDDVIYDSNAITWHSYQHDMQLDWFIQHERYIQEQLISLATTIDDVFLPVAAYLNGYLQHN